MENIVRRILREMFTEVIATQHYRDRAEVGGRLSDSEYSTFEKEPEHTKELVYKNLDYLQDVEFPEDIDVAVLVFRGKKDYAYKKPGETSFGKNIWVVIRGNMMTTMMFSNADVASGSDSQHKTRTDYQINLMKLKDYIDKEKEGDKNLTVDDVNKIVKPEVVVTKEKEVDSNVINLGGVKYVVDKDNSVIFKKNNPTQTFDLLDFAAELEPTDQERIYNLLEAYES
jgi:hypothetical protein